MNTTRLTPATRGALLALALATPFAILPLTGRDAPTVKYDSSPLPVEQAQLNKGTFAPVIRQVSPAVVTVYTARTGRAAGRQQERLLRRFSEDDGTPGGPGGQGLGSGVIVSQDGYILTNNHVVEGADEIMVALADNNTVHRAKLVGTDPRTDIAVLKVELKDLPAVTFADSDRAEVGDVVLALGNPFGIGQTVTMGIVSAKGRGGMGILDYEDFIQTDASINPGNSGGALVDAAGRLVGINTAILSRTGGNQGVGFAVPSNMARNIMERLVEDGKITRGYLGVLIEQGGPAIVEEGGREVIAGARITEVTADSPAAAAGIRAGDVVTDFAGKAVADGRQLRLLAGQTAPGTTVAVKYLRDGNEKVVEVKLEEIPRAARRG